MEKLLREKVGETTEKKTDKCSIVKSQIDSIFLIKMTFVRFGIILESNGKSKSRFIKAVLLQKKLFLN